MKIKLESNFDLGQGAIELEAKGTNLRALLTELAKRQTPAFTFIDSGTGEMEEAFLLFLNGQDYKSLPRRLDTPLKDGDRVEIRVGAVGGG